MKTGSRKDLTRSDIQRRINEVKRDRSFPRSWRDIELDYLTRLLETASE